MLGLYHYRKGQRPLRRLIAELPDAPLGENGKVFAGVKIGREGQLASIGDKIENCCKAGVLKPGSRVLRHGKELLVIVEPA